MHCFYPGAKLADTTCLGVPRSQGHDHNDKVWSDSRGLCDMAVDQVLVPAPNDQLHVHRTPGQRSVYIEKGPPSGAALLACSALFPAESAAHLPRDSDMVQVLVLDRSIGLVAVVEHNGDGRFGDPGLALLVDQVLQAVCPHLCAANNNV